MLHRLAYLIFQKKETENTRYLIIAPNRLFIDYISNVLPDLGIEEVEQSTWEDLILSYLPTKYSLAGAEQKNNLISQIASKIRGSIFLKQMIDNEIDQFLLQMIPKDDLVLKVNDRYPKEEIEKKILVEYQYLPIMRRRKRLLQVLKKWTDDILKFEHDAAKKQNLEKAFKDYESKVKKVNIMSFYKNMMLDKHKIGFLLRKVNAAEAVKEEDVTKYLSSVIRQQALQRADLAPVFYLYLRFFGINKFPNYNHIVVDEAQDLDPFQIYILRLFSANESLTLVGDIVQSIYNDRGVQSWSDLEHKIFQRKVNFLTINKSYRSTFEIVEFANRVLKNNGIDYLAEPILRHGPKPECITFSDQKQFVRAISRVIKQCNENGFHNIALIDIDAENCELLSQILISNSIDHKLITQQNKNYIGGTSVIPVHLSKGMEFDAVVLVNPNKYKYAEGSQLDIKRLYVAITRALHGLYIIHDDEINASLLASK